MTGCGTAAPLSQAMARAHRARLWHSPTEPPHLHEGLQETLRQGPEGTPVFWLLMLGLRLLQQGINVWAEAGGGTKQPQTCRGEQRDRAASTSRVQGKGPGLSSAGCGCSQPPLGKDRWGTGAPLVSSSVSGPRTPFFLSAAAAARAPSFCSSSRSSWAQRWE